MKDLLIVATLFIFAIFDLFGKDVYEVLRQKDLEISRLQKEVEALRVAAPLLSEGNDGKENKPRLASSTAPQPKRGP